jgi:hypothetical protein
MQTPQTETYQQTRTMTLGQVIDFVNILVAMNSRGDQERSPYIYGISSPSEYMSGQEVYELSRKEQDELLVHFSESGVINLHYREGTREERVTIDIDNPWDVSKMSLKELVSFEKK